MKKDITFSMRMKREIREALTGAAARECRTVSSLINKVIQDYLEEKGYLKQQPVAVSEQRHSPRKDVMLPAAVRIKTETGEESHPSVILNMSEEGILAAFPANRKQKSSFFAHAASPFDISFDLPNAEELIRMTCNARHVKDDGDMIRFGASFQNIGTDNANNIKRYLM